MGKYIKVPNISFLSDNLGQVTFKNTISDNIGLGRTIVIPNVSFASNNLGKVHIQNEHYFEYFTIESLEDNNTISIKTNGNNSYKPDVYYSTDNGETWNNKVLTSGTNTFIEINTTEKIIFKCVINQWGTAWDKYYYFDANKNFKIYGNIMSLLYGDNFVKNPEFPTSSTHNFAGLFRTTKIIDASDLILPAIIGTESCYNGMFRGATNLAHGPKELPATTINNDSYSSMFEACINLEEAPIIQATILNGSACMLRMFCMNRSSMITTPKLTKGPVLRALTQVTNCYKELFKGNGNLIEVTNLSITRPGGSTADWLLNCSTTGTFYQNPESPEWGRQTSGIPSGWIVKNYGED